MRAGDMFYSSSLSFNLLSTEMANVAERVFSFVACTELRWRSTLCHYCSQFRKLFVAQNCEQNQTFGKMDLFPSSGERVRRPLFSWPIWNVPRYKDNEEIDVMLHVLL